MKPMRNLAPVESLTRRAGMLRWLLILAAGTLLSACRPASPKAAGPDPSGVYALVSVNGKPVPASVTHEGATLQVRSGVFTIRADGTCGTTTVFVPPNGKELTREVSAEYTRNGPTLTMRWKGAGTTTGKVEGDTFTMNNEGMVFAYRK